MLTMRTMLTIIILQCSVVDEKAKVGEQARADGGGRDVQQRGVGNVFQEGQKTVCILRRSNNCLYF